jgi:hypothetical protein
MKIESRSVPGSTFRRHARLTMPKNIRCVQRHNGLPPALQFNHAGSGEPPRPRSVLNRVCADVLTPLTLRQNGPPPG